VPARYAQPGDTIRFQRVTTGRGTTSMEQIVFESAAFTQKLKWYRGYA